MRETARAMAALVASGCPAEASSHKAREAIRAAGMKPPRLGTIQGMQRVRRLLDDGRALDNMQSAWDESAFHPSAG